MTLSAAAGARARALLESRVGLEFPASRTLDLERGLSRAARGAGIATVDEYLAWLSGLPEESPEWSRLGSHLTIGETYFFRDAGSFEALEREILPAIIEARRAEGNLRLRLWSAGCATGEEPYSLAILLDRLLPDRADWSLTILATDINMDALAQAERGVYRPWSLRQTPEWIHQRYFRSRAADALELDPAIRSLVAFAPLNLARDAYPSVMTNTTAMDVILCRNVLMYFTRAAQKGVAARLRRSLVSGGWLAVSAAEGSSDLLSPLVPVNFPDAIFFRSVPLAMERHRPAPVGEPRVNGGPASVSDLARPPREAVQVAPEPRPTPPAEPRELLRRARELADAGELDEARRLCEIATTRDRLDADAHLLLAAIAQERGDIPGALEALRRTIYLAPDSAAAHFLLGSLLYRTGDHPRASRSMATVVRLLDQVPADHVVLATDGLNAGRLLAAARVYLEPAGAKGKDAREQHRG